MSNESTPQVMPPETPSQTAVVSEQPPVSATAAQPPAPKSGLRLSRPLVQRLAIGAAVVVGGLIAVAAIRSGMREASAKSLDEDSPHALQDAAITIPVNTIRPVETTLRRTLVQPGSIRPTAQAELYAKSSGYLRSIRRVLTPPLIAKAVMAATCSSGTIPAVSAVAAAGVLDLAEAPQIDIGSQVASGDLLLEIANPERVRDIIEKETLVQQREAELEAARTALASYEAGIDAARADLARAEADVRECESAHVFRVRELQRLKELVKSRTIAEEIADEKERQVNAALAAWESSVAKVNSAQAALAVNSSKLATARADIKVKETLILAARNQLALAHVLADYSRIYAPFNGIITYRDVDEGDFVQNATSGQARRLMTVTALDTVRIVLHVPDRDAPWVRVGTEAKFTVAGRQSRGTVARIAHALDQQTRTMQVEIDVDNEDRHLLPGMYLPEVVLTLQAIDDAYAIPATAVYSRKGKNYLMQVSDGVAREYPVRIRYDDGKAMEIVKLIAGREVPLDGSEQLIVSNKGEIADGQHVKPTLLNDERHSLAAAE